MTELVERFHDITRDDKVVIDLREAGQDKVDKTVHGVVRSSKDNDEKDVKLNPRYDIKKATGTGTFEMVRVELFVDGGELKAREYTHSQQIGTTAYVERMDVVGEVQE